MTIKQIIKKAADKHKISYPVTLHILSELLEELHEKSDIDVTRKVQEAFDNYAFSLTPNYKQYIKHMFGTTCTPLKGIKLKDPILASVTESAELAISLLQSGNKNDNDEYPANFMDEIEKHLWDIVEITKKNTV